MLLATDLLEIVLKSITKTESDCWIWHGPTIKNSPMVRIGVTNLNANRVVAAMCGIKVPRSIIPGKKCKNLRCVNPTHFLWTAEERFWARVERKEGDGCWIWLGTKVRGYGIFAVRLPTKSKKDSSLAHRFSYAVTYGDIPEGMSVCHHCDNPSCVRPDHLFLGTNTDNVADRDRKGRCRRGETSGTAKLREKQVAQIKRLRPYHTHKELAKMYGVKPSTIQAILNGSRWKHVVVT